MNYSYSIKSSFKFVTLLNSGQMGNIAANTKSFYAILVTNATF